MDYTKENAIAVLMSGGMSEEAANTEFYERIAYHMREPGSTVYYSTKLVIEEIIDGVESIDEHMSDMMRY